MAEYSRRFALRGGIGLLASLRAAAAAEHTPDADERRAMAGVAEAFMAKYRAPALSVAIARKDRIVYQQAFGDADSSSLFRIASVTKPITSVTLFTLIEKGRLRLDDVVFGPRGVLGNDYGAPPYRQHVEDIQIRHLLTHTGGGWQNDDTDPMFRNPRLNHRELIAWTLANLPLAHPPGEHYAYSNFGYCVLGRVIEKLTGKRYDDFVREAVLKPCGVSDMRIGGNTLAERAPKEVVYSGQGEDPYDMNVRRMDSHGGWLATASDLVRFAMRVDDFGISPSLLRPRTIGAMVTPTTANPQYACGWSVNAQNNWWHMGSLPGTTSIVARISSGLCWAALTNTRNGEINRDLDRMMWDMARAVKPWQA